MRRQFWIAVTLVVGLLLLAGARSSVDFERLRALPAAERARLARKLAEFEALPAAERERIRTLDHQVQALDPEARRRFHDLARRHERWLGAQPRAVRSTIFESPPTDRFALTERILARQARERRRQGSRALAFDDRLQVSDLNPESILLSALQLRVWFGRGEADRTGIPESAPPQRQREATLRAALASGEVSRLEGELTQHLGSARRFERFEGLLTEAVKQRLRRTTLTSAADNRLRRLELGYLRLVGEPKIAPEHLAAFTAGLPPWFRDSLDLLPPACVNRRLKLLYPLVFPGLERLPSPPGATQ